MSVQGFVIIEYMTGPKGGVQGLLMAALYVHGSAAGYSAQDFSLVLQPGNLKRRPDVAFWAVRPPDNQLSEPEKLGCPPPNLWVEVRISCRIKCPVIFICKICRYGADHNDVAHALTKIQNDVIRICGQTCAVVIIVVQQTPDPAHRVRIGKATPIGPLTPAPQLVLPAGARIPPLVV